MAPLFAGAMTQKALALKLMMKLLGELGAVKVLMELVQEDVPAEVSEPVGVGPRRTGVSSLPSSLAMYSPNSSRGSPRPTFQWKASSLRTM